jgi:hypothetical protein
MYAGDEMHDDSITSGGAFALRAPRPARPYLVATIEPDTNGGFVGLTPKRNPICYAETVERLRHRLDCLGYNVQATDSN